MSARLTLTWDDVRSDAVSAATMMRRQGYVPDVILAVARGGLAPAALLAHLLGVADVRSVLVQAYETVGDNRRASAPCMLHTTDQVILDQCSRGRTLIVDDVRDSGGTLAYLARLLPGAKTCTLAVKGDGLLPWRVDFYGSTYPEDRWLVFPWEVG